ncbi:MAG TPA: PspA/IM30 family protein [Acidimicrobiales bacterium]|nr:PspA/IM30 family protein [Acidimicrobiales bacterium]
MGVIRRLLNIFRAKANKVLDRVEDPRDSLDLSYEQQLENLQKIRRSVAEVATARKRIEIQASQLDQQAAKLQDQARQALGQGREDLAREALTRRAAIGAELTDLQAQREQIADQEEKLTLTSQRLQAQVATFRTRKETMKATYTAAEAQARIGEAAAGISESMGDAGMTIQRAQDKIAAMQARAGAIDELLASGALTDLSSSTDDIQAQLNKVATTSQVDAELAALKTALAAAPAAGLPAGSPADGAAGDDPSAPPAPAMASPADDHATSPPSPGVPGQTNQPEVTI